jgi:hypothetical protein
MTPGQGRTRPQLSAAVALLHPADEQDGPRGGIMDEKHEGAIGAEGCS